MILLPQLLACTAVSAFIVREGNFFSDSKTGGTVTFKGVVYSPGGPPTLSSPHDPLANSDACKRDVQTLQFLGINLIRVDYFDPYLDHAVCMNLLKEAGIQVLVDISPMVKSPTKSKSALYTKSYLKYMFESIEELAQYSNVMGVLAESRDLIDSLDASTIKALIRDLKHYIFQNIKQKILVGFSASIMQPNSLDLIRYFECGEDFDTVDFVILQNDRECVDQDTYKARFDDLRKPLSGFTVPIMLGNIGCDSFVPQTFIDLAVGCNTKEPFFAGAIAFQYSREINGRGLVDIDHETSDVTLHKDFYNLLQRFQQFSLPK
ncbi:glycoside hydrolase family 72 protein, partial [Tortispora caseinolytica NRRL Y-17796]